jgi:sensor histidine kinase regulating citrate/malate metabolism
MKRIIFLNYSTAMLIVTIITGILFIAVQQNYRTNANDPQVQMANDIATKIKTGKSMANFFADSVDLESSLSPFVVLYDDHAQPLQSSGSLDGKMPRLPAGVFEYVKKRGEERVTWQPRPGIRMAMVILRSNFSPVGYIAVGRSLNEIEIREAGLRNLAMLSWVIIIGILLVSGLIHYNLYRKRKAGYVRP